MSVANLLHKIYTPVSSCCKFGKNDDLDSSNDLTRCYTVNAQKCNFRLFVIIMIISC